MIGLEYQPIHLDRLYHPRNKQDIFSPVRFARDWFRQKAAGAQLLKAANNSTPILSQDSCLDSLITQLEERLEQFKVDVSSGIFA